MTNVDLTPTTKHTLRGEAIGHGFVHAELYDREQLRLALDRPEGFFIRLRYLGIPMTTEEQYRLLATVGTELSDLTTSVRSIENRVQRSEIQRGLDSKIRNVGWTFIFERWDEIQVGKHALLVVLPGLAECEPSIALSQEISIGRREDGVSTNVYFWMQGMEKEILTSSTASSGSRTSSISMMIDWPLEKQPAIYKLLRYDLRVFATASIADHATSMTLARQ